MYVVSAEEIFYLNTTKPDGNKCGSETFSDSALQLFTEWTCLLALPIVVACLPNEGNWWVDNWQADTDTKTEYKKILIPYVVNL